MNRATCYSTLIIAIVAIGIAIWQMVAAPFNDDFVYQLKALPTCENDFWELVGEPIEGFGDAAESAWNHWWLVNGRLSNILMTFSVPMPQWIVELMHGLIVGLMLWLIVRCIAPRRAMSYTWVVGVIALVMWKYFLWSNDMVSSDFLFNYTWPCVAALAYSYIFLYADKKAKVYPFVIAMIAGWMHEGFSIPLACASVVCLPFVPKELRRHRIAMIVALAVGTALCAFAPSTLMRLGRSEAKNHLMEMLRTFSRSYPIYVYMLVIAIVAFTRGWRKALSELKRNLYWETIAFVSIAIVVVLTAANRALWLAYAAMLIATLSALVNSYEWCRKPHYLIASIATLIVVVFMAELIRWQHKLSKEQYEIMEYLQTTKSPDVYYDLTEPSNLPWWVLGIPKSYSMGSTCYYMMRYITRLDIGQYCLFAPKRFEGVPYEQWDKVDGDNPFRGEYPYIYSRDSIPYENIEVEVGEAYPALSPPAELLQKIAGTHSVGVYNVDIRRCMTSQGDTLYRYFMDLERSGQLRKVKSINVK